MSLIDYVKRNIRHRHMKKVSFLAIIKLESLSNIPYINGVLFAKLKMGDSMKHSIYSKRVPITDHVVKWDSTHELICKSAIDEVTETLENSFLKITIMEEIHGGKSSRSMGSLTINLSPFCNRGNRDCRRKFIMSSGLLKKANCVLGISIRMCQKFGDPCFRVPKEEDNYCVNAHETLKRENCTVNGENSCHHKPNSNGVAMVSEGSGANFEFMITGDDDGEIEDDEYEEEEARKNGKQFIAQGIAPHHGILHDVHSNKAAGYSSSCHSTSPGYSGDTTASGANSDTTLSVSVPTQGTGVPMSSIDLPIPHDQCNELCVYDNKMKTSPSLPNRSRLLILLQQEQSLDYKSAQVNRQEHIGHRRNASAIDTSMTNCDQTEDALYHRGSGPNYVDDMNTVLDESATLLNQKRISRSSTNCYEEVKNHHLYHLTPNHQNVLFLHPSMAFGPGFKSTPNHQPQNRLSRQELVNITRGSRADIVDDVLQKVLHTKMPVDTAR